MRSRTGPSRGSPLSQERKAIYDLDVFAQSSDAVRKLVIRHWVGIEFSEFEIYAGMFVPPDGDRVAYSWQTSDDGRVRMDMPNFCLTRIEQAKDIMRKHVAEATTKGTYIADLAAAHPLAALTVDKATEYASKHPASLVTKALKLWTATRLIEGQRSICGADTLGLEAVSDPESPFFGFIPIVPIMDTQLDQLIIQDTLEPLRLEILQGLERSLLEGNPESFLETYLATFILLSSIEMDATAQIAFAKRHQVQVKKKKTLTNAMIQEKYR